MTASTTSIFTEITDDDVAGVVALWEACGLTRPWNDPLLDIAQARRSPTSTVLVARNALPANAPSCHDGETLTPDDETPTPGGVGVRSATSFPAPTTAPVAAPPGPHSGVAASVMAGFDGHRGWLYYVAVDPALQGSGLGAAAVAAGERWLRAAGARKTQLMVRTTNDQVRGFYERLGYSDQSTTVLGRWL